MAYKDRLIGYLQRFIGDLVAASGPIARALPALEPVDRLLQAAAAREARDAAPDADAQADADGAPAIERALTTWRERWAGLRGWFVGSGAAMSQAQRLRAQARAAIPRLRAAIARVNDRRIGRSDRTADWRGRLPAAAGPPLKGQPVPASWDAQLAGRTRAPRSTRKACWIR